MGSRGKAPCLAYLSFASKGQSPGLMPYAELQVTTNYSFLRGASHVEELLVTAKALGLAALGVTDRNSLAGVARAYSRAAELDYPIVVGCRLDLTDGTSLLAYPTDRAAYARLSRMLSIGKRRAGKGACQLAWNDVVRHGEGLIAILLPDEADDATSANLLRLSRHFGDRGYCALTLRRRPGDALRLAGLADLAAAAAVATVVTNDVLYHVPQRRILQDVVTCIREGCTIDALGFRRERFADRHLKSPEEMARLFARHEAAVARTAEIVERCSFRLSELRYQYPREAVLADTTPQRALEKLARKGVRWRFPDASPKAAVYDQVERELALIGQLGYAAYFLTVHSIVQFARNSGIYCQGRGSAANSAVCFVLGITEIDPVRSNLLFERFISADRNEPPDIDVDFEHERREEVIQWIYRSYGRHRAALCATVIRFRARGAVREVGRALGLTEDVTGLLASQVWGWSEDGVQPEHAAALNLDPADRRLRLTLEIAQQLIGFPRHLSQHPGGFVLTEARLDSLVPVEPASMADRQVIEWDKDDIDALHFLKVDVLGLGMLGCMRRCFDLLARHRPGAPNSMATIPQEDPATYRMIQRADTLGVFQIESRAQMAMLPRMKPRSFYDLVIEVAVVRPGPIQGDMVHPYLRRREGLEPVETLPPELEPVLRKTLGIPLFQEQAMRIAMVCGGFSGADADNLRRSMATFKVTGGVSHFRDKLIGGMVARGHAQDYAERLFRQIEGFGSYGFPESHAASFALIAYASSWMKRHHPDVFAAALLNAQPMGFYAPAQIVRDARAHGIEIRPVCVNSSDWDCTLEPTPSKPGDGPYLAVRLGLRMAKGLAEKHAASLLAARADGPYTSVEALSRRAGVPVAALERLCEADAFGALGLARRESLWAVRALADVALPLFAASEPIVEPATALTPLRPSREVVEDYRSVGLSLRSHPLAFLRETLAAEHRAIPVAGMDRLSDGRRVTIAGLVLMRQKPGSAKGVMFLTLEDETGHANLIVWPSIFERQRRLILSASMIACHGRLQRDGGVTHVIAERLVDLSTLLRALGTGAGEFPHRTGRGDEARHGGSPDSREGKGIKVRTRDFR